MERQQYARGKRRAAGSLSNVIAIAAGLHSVALKSDGTVLVRGDSRPEVLNPPAGLNDVTAIAAGGDLGSRQMVTIALRSNGSVADQRDKNDGEDQHHPEF
jgi:trimeric autotransporter adhesin